MTTSVTITGSGCPIPDARRAGPGVLVRHGELALQFDAGRATVQRLAGAGVWIPDLAAVFITHHHSDHVSALADLVLTYWTMDRTDSVPALPVVAPTGSSARFAERLLENWHDDIEVRAHHAQRRGRPEIDLIAFEVPDHPTEVWRTAGDGGDVVVSAVRVRHEPVEGAVGYRIDTPDGSIAISGDTRVCDEVAELAAGVDVLVYEAMRFEYYDDLPPSRQFVRDYHADTRLIGAQVAALDVGTLVLTHLIPAPETDADRQQFVDDVRAGGYSGDLIVADDLDTVVLSGR